MKNLLILTLCLSALSAFAKVSPRVVRNAHVLGPEMKARMKAGEMRIVDIVIVQGAAPQISRQSTGGVQLSTSRKPLVIENSCRASLLYEGSVYDMDEVCVSDSTCSCEETEVIEYRTANIAVDVVFDTDYSFEVADIIIDLVAYDPYTGESFVVASEVYLHESDFFGVGDNTVVFNIDEAYYLNYSLEARVSIGDDQGIACNTYTNTIL